MDSAVFLLLTSLLVHASGTDVTALYGETIVVPCNGGAPPPKDLMFVKWKYEKDDGTIGDLLIKQPHNDKFTVGATDGYAQRVSIDDAYSLRITKATLRDQKMFTCMVVSEVDLLEFPVNVIVRKKPSSVEIVDAAEFLQKDKLMMVGTCVAADASPAATITWKKNGETLTADGKAVTFTPSMKVDPSTGLSSTSSTLQFSASKLDSGAVFTCEAAHVLANQEAEMKPITVHYPSEKVQLFVTPDNPIVEGDNVTLKCVADGNPPPSSFVFIAKGQKTVVDSDSLLLSSVSREAAGEYTCSLSDDEKLQTSQNIVVNYLDFSLQPTGKVVKTVGESLAVNVEKTASGDVTVSWTKDGETMGEPTLSELTYADAGVYVCEASTDRIRRQHRFELVVEGKPEITSLNKDRAADGKYKVLVCEAYGVPEPKFTWSINNTNDESSYDGRKAVHKVRVIPRVNLTVTCSVSNRLGEDVKTINVSSVFNEVDGRKDPQDSEDQSKLIVGVVVGLLIAAGIVGLIYWLYMKNSRQGSWKTGEKETGTPEENKKLEENNQLV